MKTLNIKNAIAYAEMCADGMGKKLPNGWQEKFAKFEAMDVSHKTAYDIGVMIENAVRHLTAPQQ